MKRFLFYFSWTIGLGVLLYQGEKLLHYLDQLKSVTYQVTPFNIAFTLFPIILGIALKTPVSWLQRNETRWGFDWVKFVAVGVPTIYLTFILVWMHTPLGPHLPFLKSVFFYGDIQTIAGVVLGYILLDSLRVPLE